MDSISGDSKHLSQSKRLINVFWSAEIGFILTAIQWVSYDSWHIPAAMLLAIISILPVYFLAKKGKTEIGSNILLSFLTIFFLGFVWTYDGLRDEIIMLFPAIIMISLFMGSRHFAIYIYLFFATNILALGYLNEVGYMHSNVTESNMQAAIFLTIILTFSSYIAWLISTEMRTTNQALIESKGELEQRVKQRTIALEKSIEDLKNTQEQLIQTEKMASLGRLVAGVAHEINTPVGIAITASSYLEDSAKDLSKRYDNNSISKKVLANHIETTITSSKLIQSNLKRAADLIQGFKEVAVDQSNDEIREFELKHYLNEVLASLHPKIKRSQCQVNLNCPDDLFIKTYPGTIAQIITNLVINAIIHAFEDDQHGIITIDIEQQNEHICLLFKDSGCGIPPENLPNIFEPFFTTKRGKGGSGLGMHIVYNLVNQSLHGSIKCTSIVGEGTNFFIHFPCNIEI